MRSDLSQALLDRLAEAWSRLDRARPRQVEDAHQLVIALVDWLESAIRIDDELLGELAGTYLQHRSQRPEAAALLALRHAYDLMRLEGHQVSALARLTAGTHLFYDLVWRPAGELPELRPPHFVPERLAAYREQLENRAARLPAATTTTFLLRAAVADLS